jgi:hypothetical protein
VPHSLLWVSAINKSHTKVWGTANWPVLQMQWGGTCPHVPQHAADVDICRARNKFIYRFDLLNITEIVEIFIYQV